MRKVNDHGIFLNHGRIVEDVAENGDFHMLRRKQLQMFRSGLPPQWHLAPETLMHYKQGSSLPPAIEVSTTLRVSCGAKSSMKA